MVTVDDVILRFYAKTHKSQYWKKHATTTPRDSSGIDADLLSIGQALRSVGARPGRPDPHTRGHNREDAGGRAPTGRVRGQVQGRAGRDRAGAAPTLRALPHALGQRVVDRPGREGRQGGFRWRIVVRQGQEQKMMMVAVVRCRRSTRAPIKLR
ncbi:unnamed protein product [Trichogramma brassicae]|uniref:Uncharacterized protein n=1 Tax=Trichogramma brassicae TaxID=86971 RepID=A0A6H5IIE0_9HYME|nr:unnamed protein product [Trichogramma brassicae]